MTGWRWALLFACLPLAPPAGAQSAADSQVEASGRTDQDGPPATRPTRCQRPPAIDGRLDDAAWEAALVIDGFVQREPFEGRPASERTEARILYDKDALYVGVWLFDSDPDAIVSGESRRDAKLDDTDAVLLVLDTYHDGQNGFVFGTNPSGIEYDGQVSREGESGGSRSRQPGQSRQESGAGAGFNLNWDGSWTVATAQDGAGWYAEFRIPFSTLRFRGSERQVWGLNLSRHIRRRNEQAYWAPVPRQFTFYRLSLAGTLEGLEIPSRHLLQITPYTLASARRDQAAGTGTSHGLELGGDGKVGLGSGLTLDLTLNTDFAQVEVDEQQVNLTRFSLFFPEKRPFFLENAGIFALGTPRAVEMFFSRRIGIGAQGSPVPIVAGGRLTGQVAGMKVGLLDIQTEEQRASLSAERFTVARALTELPNRSRLGVFFANRAGTGEGGGNQTYAADGRWGIGEALTLNGYAGLTHTPALDGRAHTLNVDGGYTTRDWQVLLGYAEVGEDFNPGIGFVSRAGYRFLEGRLQRQLRFPALPWLRELRPHTTFRRYTGFDGFEESRNIHLDTHVELASGAFFSPAFNLVREGIREPFEISAGVVVAPGRYDYVEGKWEVNTDLSAPLSLAAEVSFGGFLSGRRRGVNGTVSGRHGSTVSGDLRLQHDRVRLPEGHFNATALALRVGYAFTPRLFVQSLVQYSSAGEVWSGNVRLGWLDTAGTGLFVVFNESQGGVPDRRLQRALTVKFTRQFDLLH